ncbi:MAG: ribosomal protein S18-alanine N-acetyltransferase [Sulfuricella sp.]
MSAQLQEIVSIRPMCLEDVEAVVAIEYEIYPFPWTYGNFRDSLNAGYSCWVYELGACGTYGDRSENSAGREQILPVLQVNSHSIDQENGEIWTGQADLQPIHHKSDRLPGGFVIGYSVMMVAVGEAHLLNLGIAPDWQGRGLGRRFLHQLINLARDYHAETLLLEVRPSNLAARRLYLSTGFSEIAVRKKYYPAEEGREDAVLMELPL